MTTLANTYPFQITSGTFFLSGTLIALILWAVVIGAVVNGWLAIADSEPEAGSSLVCGSTGAGANIGTVTELHVSPYPRSQTGVA